MRRSKREGPGTARSYLRRGEIQTRTALYDQSQADRSGTPAPPPRNPPNPTGPDRLRYRADPGRRATVRPGAERIPLQTRTRAHRTGNTPDRGGCTGRGRDPSGTPDRQKGHSGPAHQRGTGSESVRNQPYGTKTANRPRRGARSTPDPNGPGRSSPPAPAATSPSLPARTPTRTGPAAHE
jgi:hypothetical protein